MVMPVTVERPLPGCAHGPADWLCLAASPVFAAMAWAAAGDPMAFCASGPLPMNGMAAMYLLMALFHLPPWLRLVSRRARRFPSDTSTEGE